MKLMLIGSLNQQMNKAMQIAHSRGAQVMHAENVTKGMEVIRAGHVIDLIMIDVELDIASFVLQLKQEHIHIDVVACGVGNDTKLAVQAIRSGAKEYVPLPPDAEMIAAVLEAATKDKRQMIFKDPAMKSVISIADKVASSQASILITGESGTGKEVMARYVHKHSLRADKNFVSVNCAAIPENLLESELFGHEKGAFTGAIARRIGKFEQAHHGTLLLDEITEMDPKLQSKLLRVIQEKEIERVGGAETVKVDVRLIATSNRDLEKAIEEGVFREDLYFRLNVINLSLPPLRMRPLDVMALSQYFIDKYTQDNDLPKMTLSTDAQEALKNYPWPGNVRELENTMHRAVLMANGTEINQEAILLPNSQKIGDVKSQRPSGIQNDEFAGKTLANVEKDLIMKTLDHCLGNRTHAANILGISIRTLRNKLQQYAHEYEV